MYIITPTQALSSVAIMTAVKLDAGSFSKARGSIRSACKEHELDLVSDDLSGIALSLDATKVYNYCVKHELLDDLELFVNASVKSESSPVVAIYPDTATDEFIAEQLASIQSGDSPERSAPKVKKAKKAKGRKAAKTSKAPAVDKSDSDALMAMLQLLADGQKDLNSRLDAIEAK